MERMLGEISNKIWAKHVNDWLEQSAKVHEFWANQIAEEQALKLSQQIAECKEEIEKLSTNEIADIIVTATNKNKDLEEKIKFLEEELETLELIKNIILDKYDVYDGDY